MVSGKFVVVLVAAVLVQVSVAFPTETLEKDKCTALLIKSIGILKGLSGLIEANRGLSKTTQEALDACKKQETPEAVSGCEQKVKLGTGIKAIALLKTQVVTSHIGKAIYPALVACKPQNPLLERMPLDEQLMSVFTEEVLPRDLNSCFAALEASRDKLATLGELMSASAKILLDTRDKAKECFKPSFNKQCLLDLALAAREEVIVALANNLKWKEGAQSNIDSITNCLTA